ncbi:MAG: hypothetical protein K2K57_02875 [Oscillospiraceae bacterium]|nr:hypothetical protein [Oscillospiraceae bacterium]
MDRFHIEYFEYIMAYGDIDNEIFDFYFYPGDIRSELEGLELVKFREKFIGEMKQYCPIIYSITLAGFVIPYDEKNPDKLEIDFGSKIYKIKRRKIRINNAENYEEKNHKKIGKLNSGGSCITIQNIKNFSEIMLFEDLKNKTFDLYCYPCIPREIDDIYGHAAMDEFFNIIIGELEKYDPEVYGVTYTIFAIPHSEDNPECLLISYKSKVYRISKRIVTIDNML